MYELDPLALWLLTQMNMQIQIDLPPLFLRTRMFRRMRPYVQSGIYWVTQVETGSYHLSPKGHELLAQKGIE